jgi:hypothetical protein
MRSRSGVASRRSAIRASTARNCPRFQPLSQDLFLSPRGQVSSAICVFDENRFTMSRTGEMRLQGAVFDRQKEIPD